MEEFFDGDMGFTDLAYGKSPDNTNVRFYVKSVENKLLSWGGDVMEEVVNADGTVGVVRKRIKGAGHPIFEPIEYVELRGPGESKFTIIDTPAHRNGYKHKYARQYAAFKRGEKAHLIGLPLADWPGCNRADADNAAQKDIHTVEQAASAPDGVIPSVLRQRARDYLEASKGLAPLTEMRAALASRDAEMAARDEAMLSMQKQMAEQAAVIARLSSQGQSVTSGNHAGTATVTAPPKRVRNRTRKEPANGEV